MAGLRCELIFSPQANLRHQARPFWGKNRKEKDTDQTRHPVVGVLPHPRSMLFDGSQSRALFYEARARLLIAVIVISASTRQHHR